MSDPSADAAVAIGVDAGSTTWKGVAINAAGDILASVIAATDPLIERQSTELIADLRQRSGLADDTPVGGTGYGRKRLGATRVQTEITCHARGAYHHTRQAGVLVDMGGQDAKIIRIDAEGRVANFAMNDKCAAGTGRFLEVLLARLKVDWDALPVLVSEAERSVQVSSTCTVFAESEIISLIAEGKPLPGILKGLHESLASRVAALAGNLPPAAAIFMSGGVSLGPTMVDALSTALRRPITVLPQPQLVGALGAALAVV